MAERFPPATDQDYYTSIGVDHNASREDIKKAINLKTKQYHPDSQQSLTDIEDQRAWGTVTANLIPPKIGPPDQKWQPILVPPDQ